MAKKPFSIGLFCVSLLVLIPGLTEPMITIKASVDKSEILELGANSFFSENPNSVTAHFTNTLLKNLNIQGKIDVFEKTRSVTGTIHDLISSGHLLVGILIGLFAIVIPLVKILLLVSAALIPYPVTKARLLYFSGTMSKWSMTDVFVMAIMVGYMAANASTNSNDVMHMNAHFGVGFYFFTAYCVLSILAGQLMASAVAD